MTRLRPRSCSSLLGRQGRPIRTRIDQRPCHDVRNENDEHNNQMQPTRRREDGASRLIWMLGRHRGTMRPYDVALIAFRLLALWLVASALTALAETLASWKSIAAQALLTMADVSNAPTRRELFWLTTSALLARAAVGGLLWWAAPLLARHTSPAEATPQTGTISRTALFSGAAFLVGAWLLSDAIPGLAFAAYASTRPGVPAYDDGLGGARVAELVAKLVLGVAFVRGTWLARWALGGSGASADPSFEEAAAQQGDAADKAQP
jgi:hypothetical protein